MSLVTSSTQGKMLLGKGARVIPLQGAILDDLFTARIRIPCEQLNESVTLYWYVQGKPLLSAKVPAQRCTAIKPALAPIRISVQGGRCIINTEGNTLWRTATELNKYNGHTVYQNMYALFISNRSSFFGEDIMRLRQRVLRCPDSRIFETLAPEHARRLFLEAMSFHDS